MVRLRGMYISNIYLDEHPRQIRGNVKKINKLCTLCSQKGHSQICYLTMSVYWTLILVV